MISNMGETLRKIYEDAEAEGFAEGFAEGKAKGKVKTKFEHAKKMLAKNLPEDLIIEITGFSPEQIQEIRDGKDILN